MSKAPEPEEIQAVSDEYMRKAGSTIGGNRRLSICRALGQIYVNTDDEELKLKLRYASTLARYFIYKLMEYDREWADTLCPRFRDYDKVMRKEKEKV